MFFLFSFLHFLIFSFALITNQSNVVCAGGGRGLQRHGGVNNDSGDGNTRE